MPATPPPTHAPPIQVVACHSPLICLLSPSLSSLLAQIPRDKTDQLAISLPLEYQQILAITDIKADNLTAQDIFDNFRNQMFNPDQHSDKNFINREYMHSSSTFPTAKTEISGEIISEADLKKNNKLDSKKFKGKEHKAFKSKDGLTKHNPRANQVASVEQECTKTKGNMEMKNNREFQEETTANPKANDKLSSILKEYEFYLESDQPTCDTSFLDTSDTNDDNVSKATTKQDVHFSQNFKGDTAINNTEELLKDKIHQCHKCTYKTKTLSNIKIHTRICNSNNTEIPCDICGKTFKTPTGLGQHHSFCGRQSQKNYFCEQCPNSFSRKGGLTMHTMQFHTDSKSLLCEHCDYKTYSTFNLRLHIGKKHGGPKVERNTCTLCNKATYSIETHLKKYHNRY